ncbi:SDR family oxidoreductase [Streptomyces oceani]|uniref:Short-chain dehydrogenase n=1 Tax=Streptomyces oceani TaxID=1075402 RepID=A0A1E7JWK3_9ACTN|nr:SDR family oxidoreductase [Streptomyces oceani]OEU96051.1 short-chain dehydrogenase [Streptomyces oceani]
MDRSKRAFGAARSPHHAGGDPSAASGGLEGARERRVRTAEGFELRVAELGDPERPTVVLLHGYPDSKEVWSEVARALRGAFHLVLYDVRGCGRSGAPKPLRGGFTLEKLTDDFLTVLDAVSPTEPVHLVGHDWGSVQGWEFVTTRHASDRIASFTSISGPSLDHLGHWMRERLRRPTPRGVVQLLGQGAKSWYVYALHTPALPELAWRGPLGRRWWPRLLERFEKAPSTGYPTGSLPRDAAHGAWLYRDNVRSRLRHPRTDCQAHTPVQLITPTGDAFLSERLYDDLGRWAPQLTRRTLPARHWVPRTRPDQLAAWISEFASAHHAGEAGESPAGSVPQGRYAQRFAGQLVLVTGAGEGAGQATALAFAAAGARVIAVDASGEAAAHTAGMARLIGAPEAQAETVDVSDGQAMERLAARLEQQHGTVDVLINHAGTGITKDFLNTTVADWQRTLDAHLWGTVHGCRAFGGQMARRAQGGHIVNIASVSAFRPSRSRSAYATSKAAVLMLSECLRAELASTGIGVSVICPGAVETERSSTARSVRGSGTSGSGASAGPPRRKRVPRLFRPRHQPSEQIAEAVLRAVLRNQSTVPVSPAARGARLVSRIAPRVTRGLSRMRPPS